MRSFAVRRTRLALAVGLVLCLCAVPALAAPSKGYEVKVGGGTAVVGQTVAFTVTFFVPTTQQQQLGSADLTVPQAFDLLTAAIVAPGTRTATVSGDTVQLRNLALQPGDTLTVQVSASVPCRAENDPPVDGTWSVLGKQANDFNGAPGNALLNSGASVLNTPVSGFCTECPAGAPCEPASVKTGNSLLKVQGLTGEQPGQVTLALGAGPQIDCTGYREVVSQATLFNVTGQRDKTLTAEVPSKDFPKGGLNGLEVCLGVPDTSFKAKGGALAPQQGTFDFNGDGIAEPLYVGLLPDCAADTPSPCVDGRTRGDGTGVIQAQLPEGDPAARH